MSRKSDILAQIIFHFFPSFPLFPTFPAESAADAQKKPNRQEGDPEYLHGGGGGGGGGAARLVSLRPLLLLPKILELLSEREEVLSLVGAAGG